MSKTTAIRIDGPRLARGLRAAAAFVDADKKSHRHRLNLLVHEVPAKDDKTERRLFIAGGNPSSAIIVDAGTVDGLDDFNADITPSGAAIIVKLFGGMRAGGVALTLGKDTLRVSSVDLLFDNQSVEVRTVKPSRGTDTIAVIRRVLHYLDRYQWIEDAAYAISGLEQQRIAAVAKVMSGRVTTANLHFNDSITAVVQFAGALAIMPARQAPEQWTWHAMAADDSDTPWIAPGVTDRMELHNLLSGTMPAAPKPDTTESEAAIEATGADEIVDLDAPALTIVTDEEDAA